MAAITKSDMIPEQKEEAPTLKSENNAASSQPLKVQLENVADEKDNLSTVTLLNSPESWPKEPTNTTNEVKISFQKLKEQTASQSKEISDLKSQLAEAKKAFAGEKEASNQLRVKVKKLKRISTYKKIKARPFEKKMKTQENENDAAISEKFTKLQNKVGVIKSQNYDEVDILQRKVARLKTKNAKLKKTNVKQKRKIELSGQTIEKMKSQMLSAPSDYEEQIESLESEIRDYQHTEEQYKVRLFVVAKKLEREKATTENLVKRLRNFKLSSERQGKIIEADKETKVEMEDKFVALMKENMKLQRELNSGFIGLHRKIKGFFSRVVDAIL